jgi:hypothetical protein
MVTRPNKLMAMLRVATRAPEFNVVVFALLLNFPWEVLQAPLFVGMAGQPHVDAMLSCLRASLGDAAIMLLGYVAVALASGDRWWGLAPTGRRLAVFMAIGLTITIVIERLATAGLWFQNWTYSEAMPVVPGTGLGVAPLLQWVLLPLLTVWFVGRQSN